MPQANFRFFNRRIDCAARPLIMGIVNVTPDSFSDGGVCEDPEQAVLQALQMADAGADILDIGGESTRPGALSVEEAEEMRRVLPVIERLSKICSLPLSIDTRKASVAAVALEAGAVIVNDISAGMDEGMLPLIANSGAAYVAMHMRGTPENMQKNLSVYQDGIIVELCRFFSGVLDNCVNSGVDPEQVILDPGIGFGKSVSDNLTIVARLDELLSFGRPIMLGVSRKSFIGKILDQPNPRERSFGGAVCNAIGVFQGASILRVHDVPETLQTLRLAQAVRQHRHTEEFKS